MRRKSKHEFFHDRVTINKGRMKLHHISFEQTFGGTEFENGLK